METVHVKISGHRATILDASHDTYQRLREHWGFHPNGYRYMPAYKRWLIALGQAQKEAKERDEKLDIATVPGWDGKIRLLQRQAVPAGLFRATREDTEKELGLKFSVKRARIKPLKLRLGLPKAEKKYRHQNECVDAMVGALERGGGLVISATASGKTAISAHFMSRLTCPCLFVVDQIDLLYQNQKELASWLGEPVGHIGDSEYDPQRVTVGTVQTLQRHINDPKFMRWYKTVEVVIVDELHEQLNKRNFDVLQAIQPIARFGLTATLQLNRKDVRMRAHAFGGPVIFEFPLSKGVERGVLEEGRVLQLLFTNAEEEEGEYQESYEQEVWANEVKLNAIKVIVASLLLADKHVIVLATRQKHVEALSKLLHDVPHRIVYGKTLTPKRTTIKSKFEKGAVKLIIASTVFKKGINIKRVDAIVDTAEMKSKNDAQQKYGRGVRLHPDKDELIYIDIGTQDGRFLKAARSRARALRALGVKVTVKKVATVLEATQAARKFICKKNEKQLELTLSE